MKRWQAIFWYSVALIAAVTGAYVQWDEPRVLWAYFGVIIVSILGITSEFTSPSTREE